MTDAWPDKHTPIDLGDGNHRVGWEVLGDPSGDGGQPFHGGAEHAPGRDLLWAHYCAPREQRVLSRIDVTSGEYHTLVSPEPLHVEASIRCSLCGDHGFIRDGRWVSA